MVEKGEMNMAEVEPVELPVTAAPFGTTVDDVLALIPTVSILCDDGLVHTGSKITEPREGTSYMTENNVRMWIEQVSSRVLARISRFAALRPDADFTTSVRLSARDVVANGAASYAFAAGAPEKASMADTTSYAEVLWRRYVDGLEQLAEVVDEWWAENPQDEAGAGGGFAHGRFRRPAFRDYMRW